MYADVARGGPQPRQAMAEHVRHVHLFTRNIDATVAWWQEMLDGVVAFDGDFDGSRNVFMRVGEGRIHFSD